jgi:hypothetical protein
MENKPIKFIANMNYSPDVQQPISLVPYRPESVIKKQGYGAV